MPLIHCRKTRRQPGLSTLAPLAALAGIAATVALAPCQPEGAHWPRFRGPEGSGIAPFSDLPLTWDAGTGENIVWQAPLALPGANSPIVWGRRLFVTGADESRREVYCLDAQTGEALWTCPVPGTDEERPPPRIHGMTGYAAPTAATDGERVYAVFPTGDLIALDLDGNALWQRWFDMSEDIYGHASSPVLWGDLLFLQIDLGKPDIGLSHLVALSRETGETVWDIPRPVQGSWTTPIVITAGGREELVTSAKPWVIAYDPATGEEYWRVRCVEGDSAPSPIYAGGRVLVANIYASLVAIIPGGEGDVTDSHVAWSSRGSLPDICSPLSDGELVFVLSTGGVLSCYDAGDGAVLWSENLGRRFRSSPSLVGERVYLLSEAGDSVVVAARREYRELGTGRLGEPVYSSPAFAWRKMYVRGEGHLFCIGSDR